MKGNSETLPECSVPDRNRTVTLNAALEAGDLKNIMSIMGEMARPIGCDGWLRKLAWARKVCMSP